MDKPISRKLHGLADYKYALLASTAPEMFKFKEEKAATTLCRAMGGGALLYTLLTKAEWGVVPLIPFKVHLAIDSSSNLMALAAPWLFGFSKNARARNTVLALAATGLLVSFLTRREEMEEDLGI